MLSSSYLDEATNLLDSVQGKPQSLEERKRLAIELASLMIREANASMTPAEKTIQEQLTRLMKDPIGRAFTTSLADQCFRSHVPYRIADQMIYLLQQMGIPRYLDWLKRSELSAFKCAGPRIAQYLVPFVTQALRKETFRVILPGEKEALKKHLKLRQSEGVRLNLNHLGEAILSETEASARTHVYLEDLKSGDINYISVKISTLLSQINLLAFEETVQQLSARLKVLYRAAMHAKTPRFINLDMEEYRDLDLTVAAFLKTLDESEFQNYSAGIVLQAYLPNAHSVQKQLTEWAQHRIQNGGAPIKIRIVKGANLAMEQFEASLKGWSQAPYQTKIEVDANYKRMLSYGCLPEHARAVHLGVASHNLFDIAFAMLLRVENQVEPYVGFEMLEGMADAVRRVVQQLTGSMLLYCPVATDQEFQHAIAYLIRRLDENTGPENFLRHLFGLRPGTEHWDNQSAGFSESCDTMSQVSFQPRRAQNRLTEPQHLDPNGPFENEPDTDFALAANRRWARELIHHWKSLHPRPIPLVINGQELFPNQEGIGHNPSDVVKPLYMYARAHEEHIEQALSCAKAQEKNWASQTIAHRSHILSRVAQTLRERRGELIGAMMIDAGKIVSEADTEVSEAIDFAEYYRRQMERMASLKDLQWQPKGTVVVASPWNFPCAIPAGGILAALAAGNCVIFKPASDTVLVGWHLVNAFWEGGVPKEVLQFLPCSGESMGPRLIQDPRVDTAILTGGTATAQKILSLRPDLDLAAETGGKNSIIITALADRDLAIKDLLQSAFGHAGQKCSAASLAILEAEVYHDPLFLRHLRDAAASWKVGPATDPTTRINPLIHAPRGDLKRGLTTLEPGEKWLLEPKRDQENPNLWSPGIKLGVRPGSFTHLTELFGPVLGLMKADNLQQAIELANAVPYGLTAGLHSLDEREHLRWIEQIEAGNLYINRTITGAIVRRQPFGGTKLSSFGSGAKAGGPNYLRALTLVQQIGLPQEKHPVNEWVNNLTSFLERLSLSAEELGLWTASVSNYAYWWKRLHQGSDPSKIVGQDNFFRYIPRKGIALRVASHAHPLDILRICAAALTCGAQLEISVAPKKQHALNWHALVPLLRVVEETEEHFISRIRNGHIRRIRVVEPPSQTLYAAAAERNIYISRDPVLANGRFELLHYLREVSLSIDYHRYGYLGLREGEIRHPIL